LIVTAKFPAVPPVQLLNDQARVHGATTLNCAVSPDVPVRAEMNVMGVFDAGTVVVVVVGGEPVTVTVQAQALLFTFRLNVPESV
jgi:hypothetical protein